MNMRYPLGSQEWYLQQRRKDKEDSGEIKVEAVDRSAELDAMEVRSLAQVLAPPHAPESDYSPHARR